MSEVIIADLFQIQERYVRSVNLERDFEDASSLQGYVVTPQGPALVGHHEGVSGNNELT